MIVDDRKENLFSLKSLLTDLDVELMCAESGVEALNLMVDHDFALAILDVQMPEMNGFELAQLMRGAERTKNVPIIFVTAGVSTEISEFKGYESGGVDFLPKPLNPEILKCKVKIFLELAEQKGKLKEAKEAAEEASRLKSSFLANMSHEIRTPLGALMGFAELLKEDPPKDERERYLDVILRNGKSLVQIIDEILDLSKIEAGHIEIETHEVCPQALIEELGDFLSPLAEQKGLKLFLDLSPDLPKTIGTDPLRFRQILTNLLGNAIKFTEQGSVSLKIDYLDDKREPKVVCTIADTGIGISKDLARKLFQPFSQGDVSITRSFGGTGLGLSLSRKLAELLGGDVKLKESQPKKGSVFEVIVSDRSNELSKDVFETEGDETTQGTDLETLDDVRILVVDDSPDNLLFVKMLLTSQGAQVDVANNGQEGISAALEGDFDVILMDLQMPICDGLEATRILRKKGFRRPILALTANAMKEERDKCMRMGFNDYVSKPVDKKILFDAISQSLKNSYNPQSVLIDLR